MLTRATSQNLSSPIGIHKHFPHKNALAITALMTSSVVNALSRRAKSILAFLIRLAETAAPTQPSWAYKSTLASELGVSATTVYRGLKELESAELIVRSKQLRKPHNQRFSMSKIHLTEKACQLLGLLPSEDPTPPLTIPKRLPSKSNETRATGTSYPQDFYASPSLKMEDGQYIPFLRKTKDNL